MGKTTMRMKRAALPLRPEELVQVRALLAKGDPRPDVDAKDVAARLGLSTRTILDAVRAGEFPGAWKPAPNRVRIPERDIDAYRARRRVQIGQEVPA